MGRPRNDASSFWRKVDRSGGPNTCWLWLGSIDGGYGTTTIFRQKKTSAHRAAFIYATGVTPECKTFVCHKCDVPLCCNPKHLFLGSNAQNTADKVSKGRQAKGERHGSAILTERQVIEIRRLSSCGVGTLQMSRSFRVSPHTIFDIASGRRWKHVPFTTGE